MLGFEDCGKLLRLLSGGEEKTVDEIVAEFSSKFPRSLHFYACSALDFLTADPKVRVFSLPRFKFCYRHCFPASFAMIELIAVWIRPFEFWFPWFAGIVSRRVWSSYWRFSFLNSVKFFPTVLFVSEVVIGLSGIVWWWEKRLREWVLSESSSLHWLVPSSCTVFWYKLPFSGLAWKLGIGFIGVELPCGFGWHNNVYMCFLFGHLLKQLNGTLWERTKVSDSVTAGKISKFNSAADCFCDHSSSLCITTAFVEPFCVQACWCKLSMWICLHVRLFVCSMLLLTICSCLEVSDAFYCCCIKIFLHSVILQDDLLSDTSGNMNSQGSSISMDFALISSLYF